MKAKVKLKNTEKSKSKFAGPASFLLVFLAMSGHFLHNEMPKRVFRELQGRGAHRGGGLRIGRRRRGRRHRFLGGLAGQERRHLDHLLRLRLGLPEMVVHEREEALRDGLGGAALVAELAEGGVGEGLRDRWPREGIVS